MLGIEQQRQEKNIRPGEMTNLSLILRIHKVERNSQPPHMCHGTLIHNGPPNLNTDNKQCN